MSYFSFTTLSTVGFGDFYPVGNGERLLMVIVMLLGIMCFSYIMGLFTEILNIFLALNKPLEDSGNLAKFFGVMQNYNKKPLKPEIRENIA